MAEESFLFVNRSYDSGDLSNDQSTRLPSSAINGHAQRCSSRKRKLPLANRTTKNLVGWNRRATPLESIDQLAVALPSSSKAAPPEHDNSATQSQQLVQATTSPDGYITDTSATPISPAVDATGGLLMHLSAQERGVLQYYVDLVLPLDPRRVRQVSGFSSVNDRDANRMFQLIQGAVQTDQQISTYAILTVAARRMELMGHVAQIPSKIMPDELSLRAVQSLRQSIAQTQPLSGRLVLDLAYLILAELYRGPHGRPTTYRNLTRDLVVMHGGLQNLEPSTALVVLAYEYFAAQWSIMPPVLNPHRNAELLGIKRDITTALEFEAAISAELAKLDQRTQVVCQELESLHTLTSCMRALPEAVVQAVASLVQNNTIKQYYLNTAAIMPTHPSCTPEVGCGRLAEADAVYMHLRQHAQRIWLWHSTLSYLRDKSLGFSHYQFQTPPPAAVDILDIGLNITKVEGLLEGTGWSVPMSVVLWACAICFLVAENEYDLQIYKQKFERAAINLGINTEEDLQRILQVQLPLQQLKEGALTILWKALNSSKSMPG